MIVTNELINFFSVLSESLLLIFDGIPFSKVFENLH